MKKFQRRKFGTRTFESDVARARVAIGHTPQVGGSGDHGDLSGLGDDDHDQYVHLTAARTITAQHTIAPGSAQAPVVLGANAQSQLVIGLRADQLNKQVIAGNGLINGGTLTTDVTLNINPGTGLEISGDAIIHSAGDLGDLHTNYPEIDQAESITGAWSFSSDIQLDANLDFIGPQSITTSTGDLTIDAFEELNISSALNFIGAQTIKTSTGDLTIAPTGEIILNPSGNDVLPQNNYDINLGALSKKYLSLHAAELMVETLVAQETIATIGGRILVGPSATVLVTDINTTVTTITVKHNQMSLGDIAYLEGNGQVEFIFIDSGPSANGSNWDYTVIRGLEGSGDTWYAGSAVFNTGAPGDGFIDLYSLSGVYAGSTAGPTIVGNVRLLGTNLVPNPGLESYGNGTTLNLNTGFETAGGGGADVFANWIESASDGAIADELSIVQAGSHAAKLTAGASVNTLLYQDVAVVPGGRYNLSLYSRGDGTYSGRYRIYDVTNTSDIQALISTGQTAATYAQLTRSFVAPPSCVSVRVYLYCPATNGGITYFDEVYLYSSNNFASWTESEGNGIITSLSTPVHDGSNAVVLEYVTGVPVLYQSFTVVANTKYEFACWTRGDGVTDGRYSLYDVSNSAYIVNQANTGVSGTTYTRVVDAFTTPSGCVSLRIYLLTETTASEVYFDDISVTLLDQGVWSEHWAIGNLDGLYGFSSDTYGVGLGDYTSEYLTIESTNGIRMFDASGNLLVHLDGAGDLVLGLVDDNKSNLFWDVSEGQLNFRGGTGGLEIAAYINTDGVIVAGGGTVSLGPDGIDIEADDAYFKESALDYWLGADKIASIYAVKTGTTPGSLRGLYIDNWTGAITNMWNKISIAARSGASASYHANIELDAYDASVSSNATINIWSALIGSEGSLVQVDARRFLVNDGGIIIAEDGHAIGVDTGDLLLEGGISIGSTTTNPADGDLHLTGSIKESDALYGVWRRDTDYAVASGAYATVTWETEEHDSDNYWTSGTQIKPPRAGVYVIIGEYEWANPSATVQDRMILIRKNGSADIGQNRIDSVAYAATILQSSAIDYFNGSTDYVELIGRHLHGSNLNFQRARIQIARIA